MPSRRVRSVSSSLSFLGLAVTFDVTVLESDCTVFKTTNEMFRLKLGG